MATRARTARLDGLSLRVLRAKSLSNPSIRAESALGRVCRFSLTVNSSLGLQVNHRTADGAVPVKNVSSGCPIAKGMHLDMVRAHPPIKLFHPQPTSGD